MAELFSKYAKFLLNELNHRANKRKVDLEAVLPPDIAMHLFYIESICKIYRKQTREFLDFIFSDSTKMSDTVLTVFTAMLNTEVSNEIHNN